MPRRRSSGARVRVSETTGGGVVSGFLDPEAVTIVTRRLDALQPPDPADGPEPPRSLSQRRADALVALCQGIQPSVLAADADAGSGDTGSGDTRPAVGLDVVTDYDTITGAPLTNLDALRCDIEGFGPIARITAERLACDCTVGRVIMKGKSRILDYGRRTRIAPKRLRRLIALRDEHCQFPGCRAPLSWCDVHHLIHWIKGGLTDEWNLALLCRRHHVACHEGGWQLARGPDGAITAERPSGLVLAA